MDMHLWLKALHVAAVVTWSGGLVLAAVTVAACSGTWTAQAAGGSALLDAVRVWDRRVTSPAMLVAWGLGLTLAMLGNWFPAPWLMVKLGFVVLLSALHGLLSGTLRRLAREDAHAAAPVLRHGPVLVLLSVLTIVVLVVVKPF